MTATDTQPSVTDLIARIRRTDGAMATTWDIATALDIPEPAVAPLTAQARALGLITTEQDPRTMSPMHRLTDTGRAAADADPYAVGKTVSYFGDAHEVLWAGSAFGSGEPVVEIRSLGHSGPAHTVRVADLDGNR